MGFNDHLTYSYTKTFETIPNCKKKNLSYKGYMSISHSCSTSCFCCDGGITFTCSRRNCI